MFVHPNRKCGVTPSDDSLELATPEHDYESRHSCQCGCVPYISLQADRKTLREVSTLVSKNIQVVHKIWYFIRIFMKI